MEEELITALGRIKVLELELEELREFRNRARMYSRKHYLKQRRLAQLAQQFLDQDEIAALDKQVEDEAYE